MNNNRIKNMDLIPKEDNNQNPMVISALSGKGGVGKSVLISNLASISAFKGFKTLLIDCDWNFGDQHVLNNIDPEFSLSDESLKSQYDFFEFIPVKPNLDMIASPSSVEPGIELNLKALDRYLRILKIYGEYDYIFIDSPSGELELIKSIANVSDARLIVLNPELTSISCAYGLFKYLTANNNENNSFIFINRAESESDADYIWQKFSFLAQKFLNSTPLPAGYLFDDRHVYDATARQTALCELYAESSSVSRLNMLFKRLTDIKSDAEKMSRFGDLLKTEKNNSNMALAK